MSAGADKKAQLLEAVRAEPSPTRADVVRRERVLSLGASCLTALLFVLAGGMRLGSRPPMLLASSAGAWIGIAVVATMMAVWRGRAMLGPPRGWLLAGTIAVPLLLAVAWFALPWVSLGAPTTRGYSVDAACFAVTVALSAPLLLAFFVRRQDGDPLQPSVTGAALGAAAGAWGAVLIDLHCEAVDPRHVMLGHLLPVVTLALVGALIARPRLAMHAKRY